MMRIVPSDDVLRRINAAIKNVNDVIQIFNNSKKNDNNDIVVTEMSTYTNDERLKLSKMVTKLTEEFPNLTKNGGMAPHDDRDRPTTEAKIKLLEEFIHGLEDKITKNATNALVLCDDTTR
eukprot:868914_1